jgi:hypothetical protein
MKLAYLIAVTISATIAVQTKQTLAQPSAAEPVVGSVAPGPSPAQEQDSGPKISITFSPLHLILPIVEFTGEYRVAPKIGAAIIVGGGSVKAGSTTANAFEVGASVRYYLLGNFAKGLQLGGEVDYLKVAATQSDVAAKAQGVAVGPFFGGKWTSSFGLTFDGQLGYQYLVAQGHASSGTSASTSNASKNLVLLNLNVGFSF